MKILTSNNEFYQKVFKNIDEDGILKIFQENIVKTNRDHKFFVNWEKVKQNAEKLKYELNLLNVLINSKNFQKDFNQLLKKYPEVLKAFPIL